MSSEVHQAIEKSQERLSSFESRLSNLKEELTTLPSVGFHRTQFLKVQRALQFVKKAIEEEREQLAWLQVEAKEDEAFEKKYGKLSAKQEATFAEYMKGAAKRSQERRRREVEAEKRREQFRVIPGGRV